MAAKFLVATDEQGATVAGYEEQTTIEEATAALWDEWCADGGATLNEQAKAIVEAAGQSGGIDEVRRLAERGWPTDRALDGDSPELRAAIQAYAREQAEAAAES